MRGFFLFLYIPSPLMKTSPETLDQLKGKFDEDVFPEPNTGCWIWGGAIKKNGHGLFTKAARYHTAHKIAYYFSTGEFISGVRIGQICRNKLCVNPDHLIKGDYRVRDRKEYSREWWRKAHPNRISRIKSIYVLKPAKEIRIRPTIEQAKINKINSKLRRVLRGRLYRSFKKMLARPVTADEIQGAVGRDINRIRIWIENQFLHGMGWDSFLNRRRHFGEDQWQLDHRTPISAAENIEELRALSHYTNLQPLWSKDNVKKGGIKTQDKYYFQISPNSC